MKKNVEDVYPLSALQQAFLFHAAREGRADPGVVCQQVRLEGPLDADRFRQAWQQVVDRHAALRSTVHWREVKKPVQVVHRRVEAPWALGQAREEELAALVAEEKAQGLELGKPPLGRFRLVRLADEVHHLVWTFHHLLLDGWSTFLVLDEVLRLHAGEAELPEPVPYKRFVTWEAAQDREVARRFWTERLGDFEVPSLLGRTGSRRGPAGRRVWPHPPGLTDALGELARSTQSTVGTLVSAAWGVLLAERTGRSDVVFGATVAGRSLPIPGVDRMVGLLMNVVPVRAHLPREGTFGDYARRLALEQARAAAFEATSLADIRSWSGVPGNRPFFDTLLTLHSFPRGAATAALRMTRWESGLNTTVPLALSLLSDRLEVLFDRDQCSPELVDGLGARLLELLDGLAPDREMASLVPAGKAPDRRTDVNQPRLDYVETAPRSPMEVRLLFLWEKVFGARVGRADDFFERGGDSMLALRLFQEMEQELGRRLPLATLLEHPTVERLAKVLEDEGWSRTWESLVPIQPEGERPPLYCVHAEGGHVLFCRPLARVLGRSQPLYGLQAVGVDGLVEPLPTVEAMARHYLEEIRTVQPRGPYHLVGRCLGGFIAFEMAQALHRQGEEVGLLAIIDSRPPRWNQRAADRYFYTVGQANNLLRYVHHRRWDLVQQAVRSRRTALLRRLRLAPPPPADTRPHLTRLARHLTQVAGAYRATPYPGSVVFIRSRDFAERPQKWAQVFGWSRLALGGLKTPVLPVVHDTMYDEPDVEALARCLEQALESRDAACGRSKCGARGSP